MLGTKAQLPCSPSPPPHSRVGSKGDPCQQSQASHPALQQYLHVLAGVFAPSADDGVRHAGLPRVSVAEWEPGLRPPCPAHVRAEHGWGRALEQTRGAQVWLLPPLEPPPRGVWDCPQQVLSFPRGRGGLMSGWGLHRVLSCPALSHGVSVCCCLPGVIPPHRHLCKWLTIKDSCKCLKPLSCF